MSEDLRLTVERRSTNGSVASSRLRAAGRVPAIVYGLSKPGVSVSVSKDLVEKLVATRASVVDVELDGHVEKAIVKELQWDVFSTAVQHVDFLRVNPASRTQTEVALELRGDPIGLKDGGAVRQHLKSVTIDCPDFRIPKSIQVRIGALKIGDVIKAGDLPLPEHATLVTSPDVVIVELYDSRKAV